jgi:hypothetical protein
LYIFVHRSELNKCMAVFMNSKLKFTQMTRVERLSCTKVSEYTNSELTLTQREVRKTRGLTRTGY